MWYSPSLFVKEQLLVDACCARCVMKWAKKSTVRKSLWRSVEQPNVLVADEVEHPIIAKKQQNSNKNKNLKKTLKNIFYPQDDFYIAEAKQVGGLFRGL